MRSVEEIMADIIRLEEELKEAQGALRLVSLKTDVTYMAPDGEYSDTWDIIWDLRTTDDDANYACADALRKLYPTVSFDPETSCFYAYAPDEQTARKVAADVRLWVSERP